jgi:hypothetical protein
MIHACLDSLKVVQVLHWSNACHHFKQLGSEWTARRRLYETQFYKDFLNFFSQDVQVIENLSNEPLSPATMVVPTTPLSPEYRGAIHELCSTQVREAPFHEWYIFMRYAPKVI